MQETRHWEHCYHHLNGNGPGDGVYSTLWPDLKPIKQENAAVSKHF